MNYEEGKDMLPGMAVGKGSVCLFRKTVWKGQSSICLANSDGIVGIGMPCSIVQSDAGGTNRSRATALGKIDEG